MNTFKEYCAANALEMQNELIRKNIKHKGAKILFQIDYFIEYLELSFQNDLAIIYKGTILEKATRIGLWHEGPFFENNYQEFIKYIEFVDQVVAENPNIKPNDKCWNCGAYQLHNETFCMCCQSQIQEIPQTK